MEGVSRMYRLLNTHSVGFTESVMLMQIVASSAYLSHLFTLCSGTVVSVNSWGYSSSSGMAGPDLSTEKGSLAECLYQRARDTPFDNVSNGGLIVPDCDPQ